MFAIAFDLDTKDTKRAHPKGLSQAYTDIRVLLGEYDFEWRQGSVYTSDNENPGQPVRRRECAQGSAVVSGIGPRHSRVPREAVVGLHPFDEVQAYLIS